jgi:hypothetical protein
MARARRGRGEGSIYQRKGNVWRASVSLGYDGDGKRIRRTITGKSKAIVTETMRRLQRDTDTSALPAGRSPTLTAYLNDRA